MSSYWLGYVPRCSRCGRARGTDGRGPICLLCAEELDARQAQAVALWRDGCSTSEIGERIGVRSTTVERDLSKAGIGPAERRVERYRRDGRAANGSSLCCLGCDAELLDAAPRQDFCGPECAKLPAARARAEKAALKPARDPAEVAAARGRSLRAMHANMAGARKEIFGWLKRQRKLKELEE